MARAGVSPKGDKAVRKTEATLNQAEAALQNGSPKKMYALIPKSQRKAFEAFARCFGITNDDIQRLRNMN